MGTEALLAVAHAFCAARGLKLSTVSGLVLNDWKRLGQIESGADITVGRLTAVMQRFSDNWPDGAAWPVDVPRPAPAVDKNRRERS